MEKIREFGATVLIGGVTAMVAWQVFSCYRKTGSLTPKTLIGCFLKDTTDIIGKVGIDLAKDVYNKGLKPGAKKLYNKALKPIGKETWNKVLKPGYKQLKHTPKLIEKASQKAVRAVNPLSSHSIVQKGIKKGAHSVKKGFKKVFHF